MNTHASQSLMNPSTKTYINNNSQVQNQTVKYKQHIPTAMSIGNQSTIMSRSSGPAKFSNKTTYQKAMQLGTKNTYQYQVKDYRSDNVSSKFLENFNYFGDDVSSSNKNKMPYPNKIPQIPQQQHALEMQASKSHQNFFGCSSTHLPPSDQYHMIGSFL